MTRLAKRPAIMPKFDSIIVAPRNSSARMDQGRGVGAHAVELSAQVGAGAFADIAQNRNEQPAFKIHGDAEIDTA